MDLASGLKIMALKYNYSKTLEVISEKSPPAKNQGKNHCCQSGVCCWQAPCELTSEDIDRLIKSNFLSCFGYTRQLFFQHYCRIDWFPNDVKGNTTSYLDGVFLVRLRRSIVNDNALKMISNTESYDIGSPCILLETNNGTNKCQVHDDAKPTVGMNYKCWDPTTEEEQAESTRKAGWSLEQLKEIGWDGIVYRDEEGKCEYLPGFKPENK